MLPLQRQIIVHSLRLGLVLQCSMMRSSSAIPTHAEKEEIDSRSIYVGNVDYGCTANELERHFQPCGTVNRVTILTDLSGHPKGFAYVEFVEVNAVRNAVLLNESVLHGRQLKISHKRTNIPGLKMFRGRRPCNSYFRFPAHGRGGAIRPPPPFFNPRYGHGKRHPPMRYRPYY